MRRRSDFFRQVSPPDELSTLSNGTPTGKSTDLKDKGEGSSLPNGESARNIGRPSPDSPNLKSRNLDRSESYGRKPAEGFDGGYVHDSGSGSARVIPYDSGFANNSSPLRKASIRVAHRYLDSLKPPLMKTSARPIRIDKNKIKALTKGAVKTLEDMINKSKYKTLSETLKRKTYDGKISLGSYPVIHETTGNTYYVEISLGVEDKKGRAGLYTYKPERELHLVDVYLEDKSIELLTNSFFYDFSVKPAWTKRIFSTLIHEITHAVERIKYLKDRGTGSETDMSMIKTRKDQKKVMREYHNHPIEVKAFLQQIAHEVEEYFIKNHGGVSKESLKKGFNDAFGYYGSETWKRVSTYLTQKNQKYIKKAVLTHLMEVLENQPRVARMFTQFTNWVKGDSDLIEEYIAKLGNHLEKITPAHIEASWGYTGQDDLRLKLSQIHFPLINVVRKNKVNLNAKAKEIQIKNKLHSAFEIEDIHYDHDLKDLFGSVDEQDEIRLIENLGKEKITEEVLSAYSRHIQAFNQRVCLHYAHKVIRPYMSFYMTGFHTAYDPHPLPHLNLPHGHFKGLKSRGFKDLRNGVVLNYSAGYRSNRLSSIKFFVQDNALKTEVKSNGKTVILDGFLDDVSCLRIAWLGL